MDVVSYYTYI